jgi:hypothetical protein
MTTFIKSGFIIVILAMTQFIYAQTDHSDHMQHGQQVSPSYTASAAKGQLEVLSEVPDSGKSREAGSDGRYIMETTSVKDNLAQLCAKGSRGIVILDNETWKKCGGKPDGLKTGDGMAPALEPMDHSAH